MSGEPQQATLKSSADASIRVSAEARRRLLTIQYARKMAGQRVSLNDIVEEGLDLLERAGVP